MDIIENYSTTIVTIFQNVVKDYERNIDRIKEIQDELNDIDHEIEFGSPKNMYAGYLLYKRRRELRTERRRCKDEVELMKETYEFFKSQQGQSFKNKMQALQGSARKIRNAQEQRTYKPRVRDDLTIEGITSTEHAPFEEMLKDFNKTKVTMQNGKLRK